jgi:hypothetical protein
VGGFTGEKNTDGVKITPIPRTQTEGTITLSAQEKRQRLDEIAKKNTDRLSQSARDRLNQFKSKIPVNNDDFEMRFSSDLNSVIISKKSSNADQKMKDFLRDNGVLDLYEGGEPIFIVDNKPADEIINKANQDLLDDLDHGSDEQDADTQAPQAESPSADEQAKEVQLLSDLLKTMLTFDLGAGGAGGTTPPPTSGSIIYPPNLAEPISSGYYLLPQAPNSEYHIYSCPARRYGKKELIGVIYTVAKQYKERFPDSQVHVGDLNAGAPHSSHRWGIAVDLDACCSPRAADYTKGNYSREATVELGKLFVSTNLIKNIWYCDEAVNQAVLAYARQNNLSLVQMKCIKGHADHFHIDINIPRGPESAPNCGTGRPGV